MDNHLQSIGKRIQMFRKRRGMTQEVFAAMIDKSVPFVSYLETGQKLPALDTLIDIANALQITPNDILYECIMYPSRHSGDDLFRNLFADCSEEECGTLMSNLEIMKNMMRGKNKG